MTSSLNCQKMYLLVCGPYDFNLKHVVGLQLLTGFEHRLLSNLQVGRLILLEGL